MEKKITTAGNQIKKCFIKVRGSSNVALKWNINKYSYKVIRTTYLFNEKFMQFSGAVSSGDPVQDWLF